MNDAARNALTALAAAALSCPVDVLAAFFFSAEVGAFSAFRALCAASH